MLVFFFCFYFLLFFFPLKLHVIDRTATYTRSLLQLFPSVDLSRKKILSSSPPPFQICRFFFLSFFLFFIFFTRWTKFQAVLLTRSSIRNERNASALYPTPPLSVEINFAGSDGSEMSQISGMWPEAGPATNVWRV